MAIFGLVYIVPVILRHFILLTFENFNCAVKCLVLYLQSNEAHLRICLVCIHLAIFRLLLQVLICKTTSPQRDLSSLCGLAQLGIPIKFTIIKYIANNNFALFLFLVFSELIFLYNIFLPTSFSFQVYYYVNSLRHRPFEFTSKKYDNVSARQCCSRRRNQWVSMLSAGVYLSLQFLIYTVSLPIIIFREYISRHSWLCIF